MRDWQLTADSPLSLRFAADARFGRTDYTDDQVWEVAFGGPEEPALAFQTRYGGRAGLARLVPMWVFDSRVIYEGMAFAGRPSLRAFAPNYARITARMTNTLLLTAELWVMESHAVGGRFTLENQSDQRVTARLDLVAQVMREGKVLEMNLLGLEDGSEALHLGRVGNLNPVLLLEGASTQYAGQGLSPKLVAQIIVPAKGSAALRWVHAGQVSFNDSLQTAYRWLRRTDWETQLKRVEQINTDQISIETGSADWDAALAFSAHVLLRSFVGPTGNLPHPSYVSARIPGRGFSPRGDGGDHGWQWSGQTAALGYLALPSAAMLAPDLARGAIRNALAVEQADGWIDFKPGLGGQRAGMLSLPLLATTAWKIYEYTEDKAFVAEIYPGLRQFFERWFQSDTDRDGDGLPEWANTTQSGFVENPIFARFRRWAQNADISKAESPDLAAYLVSEAHSLLHMAELIGDAASAGPIQARLEALLAALGQMWHESAGSYLYRDRDTDQTVRGVSLFRGKGDEALDVKTPLAPPNRLILRVVGGRENAPRFQVIIEGVDAKGTPVAETVLGSAFAWYYGMGAAVSEQVYSQINYIKFEGLIRLYALEVDTVDLTRQNLTQLLPLWAGVPDPDRAAQIVHTLTDEARYWRPFGLPVCPANDPAFAANNDGGSGGVWMLWNALLIEGLLRYGFTAEAAALFVRLLDAQVRALRRDHAFRDGYNSETGEGLGDIDELGGIMPLAVFMQLIGLRVVNERRVWAGGVFALPNPVTVRRGAMEIVRSTQGTAVRFASGYTAQAGPEWQLIEDPTPVAAEPPKPAPEPAPLEPTVRPRIVLDEPEMANEPAPVPPDAERIPVEARKDDTMEIPISQIDFVDPNKPVTSNPAPSSPSSESSAATPTTIKIPVRRPKQDA